MRDMPENVDGKIMLIFFQRISFLCSIVALVVSTIKQKNTEKYSNKEEAHEDTFILFILSNITRYIYYLPHIDL